MIIELEPFRGLNPFEVREVSKQNGLEKAILDFCLNPFEVREVSKPI